MADTLETLEIEISHKSSDAADEIGKVSNAISGLSRSLTNVIPKLTQFAEIMGKVKNPVSITTNYMSGSQADKAITKAGQAAKSAAKGISELSNAAHKSKSPLDNLVGSLKRIAFYRMIRSVIKEITEAFQEGLKNAYAFSSIIGSSISQTMDRLSSLSLTMKNQLGAAFGELLTTLQPILEYIIQAITKIADTVAQFFAVLGGRSTYHKALESTAKWVEETDKGSKAAKEWKNQLLGFDEINRLEAPSEGSRGSNKAADNIGNWELSPVTKEFPWLEKIKEHMELIKDLAIGIGAALLAWRVVNMLDDLLGLNLALSQILGIAIAIGGATIYVQGFMDAWNNGPDWDNIIEMLLGVTLTAVGLGLAFGSIWAGLALVIGGIGMLVAGCKNWIETGTLTTETFWLLEAGIGAVAIGIALMTGSWIPLLIGGIAAVALAVVKNWDEIKQKLNEAVQKFKDALERHFKPWAEDIKKMLNGIKTTFQGIIDFIVGVFTGDWERALNGIKEIAQGIIDTISGHIQAAMDFVRGLIGLLQEAWSWVSGLFTSINDYANTQAYYNEQSGMLYATDPVYSSSSYASTSQSPIFPTGHFASGGWPDEGQLFMAREAGPEMVGTIGGRTAVATNADIVAAIEGGVFNAMSAALSTSGGNGSGTTILNINGREFMRAIWSDQQAVAREHGVALIANGKG